jgi:hypothetical protein
MFDRLKEVPKEPCMGSLCEALNVNESLSEWTCSTVWVPNTSGMFESEDPRL